MTDNPEAREWTLVLDIHRYGDRVTQTPVQIFKELTKREALHLYRRYKYNEVPCVYKETISDQELADLSKYANTRPGFMPSDIRYSTLRITLPFLTVEQACFEARYSPDFPLVFPRQLSDPDRGRYAVEIIPPLWDKDFDPWEGIEPVIIDPRKILEKEIKEWSENKKKSEEAAALRETPVVTACATILPKVSPEPEVSWFKKILKYIASKG